MSSVPGVVSSRHNGRVKQLRGAFAGHPRLSNGLVALEGEHLVAEAIRSGMLLKTVFLSESRPVPTFLPRSVEILRLDDDLFATLGETRSPQGIAALMVPPVPTLDAALWGIPLLLVACGLQDAGNLGTLIRSAEAFGASGVLALPGTVNAWSGKVLRASVGSIFRTPVVSCSVDDLLALKKRGIRLLAAVGDASDGTVAVDGADLSSAVALLIGNEGSGLSDDLLALADGRVTVPSAGIVESLNAGVAGSILLYEAFRQRSTVGSPAERRAAETRL